MLLVWNGGLERLDSAGSNGKSPTESAQVFTCNGFIFSFSKYCYVTVGGSVQVVAVLKAGHAGFAMDVRVKGSVDDSLDLIPFVIAYTPERHFVAVV